MNDDILQYFPYEIARPVQEESLRILEENWDRYDVFVVIAPTAFGKSAFSRTLMNWKREVVLLTPQNLLVQQFVEEFPETDKLVRMDLYQCEEYRMPCVSSRKFRPFCEGCQCSRDLRAAIYQKGPVVTNYHMFVARKMERRVLVLDEAHNVIPIISDFAKKIFWHHKWGYPEMPAGKPVDREKLTKWCSTQKTKDGRVKKALLPLLDALTTDKPIYVVGSQELEWTGGGTLDDYGEPIPRGEAVQMPALVLQPVDIRDVPARSYFTPSSAEKIVLMSATIGRKDIQQLGLDRRRTLFIECQSPIPVGGRPIIVDPVANVNRGNLAEATAQISEYIEQVILPRHPGEKGLIHATYAQARILRDHLTSPRFIFHDSTSKAAAYMHFREAPPDSGAVLVASGMYEGLDLPEDYGRFQVITKIPWKSLGDPAVRYLADQDPEWYHWETWKTVLQASGRICRTPEDYGVTYILDGAFERLPLELAPSWWKEALHYVGE